jgi:hypothetical protein
MTVIRVVSFESTSSVTSSVPPQLMNMAFLTSCIIGRVSKIPRVLVIVNTIVIIHIHNHNHNGHDDNNNHNHHYCYGTNNDTNHNNHNNYHNDYNNNVLLLLLLLLERMKDNLASFSCRWGIRHNPLYSCPTHAFPPCSLLKIPRCLVGYPPQPLSFWWGVHPNPLDPLVVYSPRLLSLYFLRRTWRKHRSMSYC